MAGAAVVGRRILIHGDALTSAVARQYLDREVRTCGSERPKPVHGISLPAPKGRERVTTRACRSPYAPMTRTPPSPAVCVYMTGFPPAAASTTRLGWRSGYATLASLPVRINHLPVITSSGCPRTTSYVVLRTT